MAPMREQSRANSSRAEGTTSFGMDAARSGVCIALERCTEAGTTAVLGHHLELLDWHYRKVGAAH